MSKSNYEDIRKSVQEILDISDDSSVIGIAEDTLHTLDFSMHTCNVKPYDM
ncbi:hypothetical protein KAU11_11440 [Candidatus Babeliales bacterium]|nr:hypothetical protein [Candidatus Babeliales bacterium]